ncbi:MAG TPA: ABC transporter permease [Jatrophihabitantaceae bacterium]|nr:ABC transporter permease [Jatrophihabitantaceae bacterium]
MINLIRAEFLKLRTTQVWFWLLLASIAVSALIVVAAYASHHGVQNSQDVADVFGSASTSDIAVFILGILGVTTEFRYQTITPTVLATPSRWAIVTAKMITYGLVGAAFSAICVLVEVAIAVPWISSKHLSVGLGDGHIPHSLIGVFVVVALYGIIGLGVGSLVKNQIVAVSVGLLFLLILENIVLAIPKVKNVYPFTPAGASSAILTTNPTADFNGITLLSTAGGVIVLLLWAIVPAVLGASITMNRDIT